MAIRLRECCFLAIAVLFGTNILNAQVARDNFNVIFENNFDHNQLGTYKSSEFANDWNRAPGSSPHGNVQIINDSDPVHNKVLRGYFPEGTFSTTPVHGWTWYSELATKGEELYFSYDIKFKPGFEWVHGGKIPGITGGSVTSGTLPSNNTGFSTRMMWKGGGTLVFYVYHHDQAIIYGDSYIWENFKFTTGKWYNITIRVVLNTVNNGVGSNNGILEGFIDGKLVFQKTDFRFRNLSTIKIDKMYICSFFGGGTDDWAATRDEWIDTDNYFAYTYSNVPTDVPRGRQISQWTKALLHPNLPYSGGTPNASVPAAPSGLKYTLLSKSSATLTWSDNSNNEQGFKIYRSLSATNGFAEVGNLSSNLNSFTNNSLQPGTDYFYKLLAYNQNGNSAYTPVYKITTPLLDIPSPPSVFTSPTQTSSTIDLTWKDNSTRELGFKLYRSTSANDGYIEVASCEANETSCSDVLLTSGTVYHYKLRAYNADGYSDYTPILQVSTKTGSGPVTDVNHAPVIANQLFSVTEPLSSNIIGSVISSDPDQGQKLTYSIASGNDLDIFSIDAQSGQLKATNEIFGPVITTYTVVVKVTDNANQPLNSSASITVKATGNSKIIYIDPENLNDINANGSIYHPFDSWSDITWKEGYSYLQKKSTTTSVGVLQIGASNVTLGAYGEGEMPVISSQSANYLISGFEKSGIEIKDLHLKAPNAVSCIYFLGSTADSLVVEHCILNGNVNAIKVVDGSNLIAKYNKISSGDEGIFSTAGNNEIYYNIFDACNTAVNIMGNSSKARIYNNVFVDNTKSLSVSYAELTLHNNIFYLSEENQVALNHGTGKITSDNNIFYPEQKGFITVAGKFFDNLNDLQKQLKIDLKSFTKDPLFMDITNKKFNLNSKSPAINSGKNLSPGSDIEGTKVPMFSIADIGAFEFNGNIYEPSKQQSSSVSMKLYPNPSTGPVTIEGQIDESLVQNEPRISVQELKILDMTGKTILSKKINMNSTSSFEDKIDLSGHANGLYFVVLQIADKIINTKLLINK